MNGTVVKKELSHFVYNFGRHQYNAMNSIVG